MRTQKLIDKTAIFCFILTLFILSALVRFMLVYFTSSTYYPTQFPRNWKGRCQWLISTILNEVTLAPPLTVANWQFNLQYDFFIQILIVKSYFLLMNITKENLSMRLLFYFTWNMHLYGGFVWSTKNFAFHMSPYFN